MVDLAGFLLLFADYSEKETNKASDRSILLKIFWESARSSMKSQPEPLDFYRPPFPGQEGAGTMPLDAARNTFKLYLFVETDRMHLPCGGYSF